MFYFLLFGNTQALSRRLHLVSAGCKQWGMNWSVTLMLAAAAFRTFLFFSLSLAGPFPLGCICLLCNEGQKCSENKRFLHFCLPATGLGDA